MRCYCCNNILTNYEATLRNRSTDEFTDICLKCLKGLSINVEGNKSLLLDKENPEVEDYLYEDISQYIGKTNYDEE